MDLAYRLRWLARLLIELLQRLRNGNKDRLTLYILLSLWMQFYGKLSIKSLIESIALSKVQHLNLHLWQPLSKFTFYKNTSYCLLYISKTQSNMVTIKRRPYVALFPIGCDTLCDTAKLIPPLPLGPGQTYNGVYVIKWYVDGTYHSTGPVLNLSALTLGQHQINIVVNFIGDTCAATSGKYDLFIKHCGDCDCKESHWGETQLTEGEKPPAAKNNVKAAGTFCINLRALVFGYSTAWGISF